MILVTGATGTLGSVLLSRLVAAQAEGRALSRWPSPRNDEVDWAEADLRTGDGLNAAIPAADVIVHAASDAKRKSTDGDSARRLIAAARAGRRLTAPRLHLHRRRRRASLRVTTGRSSTPSGS